MRDGQHEARQTGTNAPLVRFSSVVDGLRSVQLALARERTANLTLLEAGWRMTSPRGRVLTCGVFQKRASTVRCYRRYGVATPEFVRNLCWHPSRVRHIPFRSAAAVSAADAPPPYPPSRNRGVTRYQVRGPTWHPPPLELRRQTFPVAPLRRTAAR